MEGFNNIPKNNTEHLEALVIDYEETLLEIESLESYIKRIKAELEKNESALREIDEVENIIAGLYSKINLLIEQSKNAKLPETDDEYDSYIDLNIKILNLREKIVGLQEELEILEKNLS